MTFASLDFLVYLLAAVVLYYITPMKIRWLTLLILSYGFYLSGGLGVLSYILFTTFTSYCFGFFIGSVRSKDDTKESKAKAKRKKHCLAAAVMLLNFGLLYFVKYWNFTLDILKVNKEILRFDIIMPLGISFYIFQSMGYIIDVLRGKYSPEKNFLKFALFVSFFPQLTQGPIGRYDKLSPQLYNGNPFSFDNIKEGIKLIVWGYIKKIVIADRCAVVACAIIDNYSNYCGSIILLGILFYCVQLYCDFSGGIDVARGCGRLFGIDMALNFKRPLFATSLADFWRRWHITLGSWLKDYLFYPLTFSRPFIFLGKFLRKHLKGKAGKILPTSIATFIVYLVIGLWHGANWKYIVFGCWNGIIITTSLLLEPYFTSIKKKLSINESLIWYKVFCIARTSIIVVLGRYITRASGVGQAIEMFIKTVNNFNVSELFSGTLMNLGLTLNDYIVIIIGIVVIFVLELGEEAGMRITERIENKSPVLAFALSFITAAVLVYFGIFRGDYVSSEFIYKQF